MKLLLPLMIILAIAMFGKAEGYDPCPQGWSHFQKRCYRYFGDRVNWEEALKRCRKLYSINGQADLISIHNRQENDFAYDLFHTAAGITPDHTKGGPPYYGAWIGLYQVTAGSTGPFVWTDGTSVSFQSWLPGQPDNYGNNEDCAHFWRRNAGDDTLRSWNDLPCNRDLPYICKMAPNYE